VEKKNHKKLETLQLSLNALMVGFVNDYSQRAGAGGSDRCRFGGFHHGVYGPIKHH